MANLIKEKGNYQINDIYVTMLDEVKKYASKHSYFS